MQSERELESSVTTNKQLQPRLKSSRKTEASEAILTALERRQKEKTIGRHALTDDDAFMQYCERSILLSPPPRPLNCDSGRYSSPEPMILYDLRQQTESEFKEGAARMISGPLQGRYSAVPSCVFLY
jgi:hypothetical protein